MAMDINGDIQINYAERNDKSEYTNTNQKIREYKKGRD